MSMIQSMEDLIAAREQALEEQRLEAARFPAQVMVGMSTCGVAAGAAAVWDEIETYLADPARGGTHEETIRLTPIGCIGLCALEPIVQVQLAGQPLVTYGKVTREAVRRILMEHIGKGIIVAAYQIENA